MANRPGLLPFTKEWWQENLPRETNPLDWIRNAVEEICEGYQHAESDDPSRFYKIIHRQYRQFLEELE